MINKLFDEIGLAYAENKRQYPSYLVMTHDTYGMIMYNKVPEGFIKRRSIEITEQFLISLFYLMRRLLKAKSRCFTAGRNLKEMLRDSC